MNSPALLGALASVATFASHAAAQEPAGAPDYVVVAIPSAPIAYQGPDAVPIHLTNASNGSGTLFQESASGWEAVCALPCSTTVDPKATYKLHGSDPFRFPSGAGSLDVVADYDARRAYSQWAAPLGILGFLGLVASPVLLLAPFQNDGHGTMKPLDSSIGWTTLGISGAMTIAAIVLASIHAPTTVTTTEGRRIAKVPSLPLPGRFAWTTSGIAF